MGGNGVQGVGGSNPLVPTIIDNKTAALVQQERLFLSDPTNRAHAILL